MHKLISAPLSLFACGLTLGLTQAASAAVLSVNLGRTAASTTETGFTDWFVNDGIAGPVTNTISGIDLTGSVVGGNLRTIDRNFRATYSEETSELPELSQSWWGVQGSTSVGQAKLSLTLDGEDLGAGQFTWTSWHVDHDDQTGDMLIEVSVDGGATFSTAIASFDIVDGRDEDLFAGAPNPATFNFTANGSDDVVIRYSNLETASKRNFVVVNGFEVAAIPEPASLALMGLGGLLMLGRGRRDQD